MSDVLDTMIMDVLELSDGAHGDILRLASPAIREELLEIFGTIVDNLLDSDDPGFTRGEIDAFMCRAGGLCLPTLTRFFARVRQVKMEYDASFDTDFVDEEPEFPDVKVEVVKDCECPICTGRILLTM